MNWEKFRGTGITLTGATVDGSLRLNLSAWIESVADRARRDRVEVAHARLKRKRS
jgi:hypothetical protein